MGQSKHNPTAILAKQGLIPPKKPKISRKDLERIMMLKINQQLLETAGLPIIKDYYR